MALTVRSLLEEALYLSIADREFSPIEPDGSQINVALNTFIRLLSAWEEEVPFWETKTISAGDGLLNVDAAEINYMQYRIGGDVLYPMYSLSQKEFSTINTIENVRTIPRWYWHDRGSNAIRVYPLPVSPSDEFIIGFRPLITIETLDQPLPQDFEPFMQQFYTFETAYNLSMQYNVVWTPDKEKARNLYYRKLRENSQNAISAPMKPRLKGRGRNVPWLAYISGNTPSF